MVEGKQLLDPVGPKSFEAQEAELLEEGAALSESQRRWLNHLSVPERPQDKAKLS